LRKDDQTREREQTERIYVESIPKNLNTDSYNSSSAKEAARLGVEVKRFGPDQFMLSVKKNEQQVLFLPHCLFFPTA
jgi:hypothetical protein